MSDAPDLPSRWTVPYVIDTIAAAGPGVAEIAEERRRQVEREGWTPEHDDHHAAGTLARAAGCYLQAAHEVESLGVLPDEALPAHIEAVPLDWPWARVWWKPSTDAHRMRVKAGALVAAEIARGLRCGART